MKTEIIITGQINGNYKLFNALNCCEAEHRAGMFNSHTLTFKTKKEAIKAMREGYWIMKRADLTGVKANRDRTLMYYDASKAEVIKREYYK